MCFDCLDMMGGNGFFNPWIYRAEKSASAERREASATTKFEAVRSKVESVMADKKLRVIALGRKPGSQSMFRFVPRETMEHIYDFVLPKLDAPAATAGAVAATSILRRTKTTAKAKALTITDGMEKMATFDAMDSLDAPGNKITFPLLQPKEHLTGPCWRDFSRAVRTNADWDVKRTKATPEEKEKAGETRKGNVYFVSAIYTVPGAAPKKKRAKKKAVPAKEGNVGDTDGDSKPAAKKISPPPTAQHDEGNNGVEMESKPPAPKKAKMTPKAD